MVDRRRPDLWGSQLGAPFSVSLLHPSAWISPRVHEPFVCKFWRDQVVLILLLHRYK